jgi:hypothetical protein
MPPFNEYTLSILFTRIPLEIEMAKKSPQTPDLLKLKAEVTRRSYCIEVDVEDFLAVERAEDILGGGPLGNKSICDQLTALLRAAEVEYNGHFGPNYFFSMDIEEDTKRNHGKILTIIRNQIIKARRYVARMDKQKA